MKLEHVVSAPSVIVREGKEVQFTERVVLISGGREVYRGYAPPFELEANGTVKEEFEFQGKLFVLSGESMGAKLFREVPMPAIPTPDVVVDGGEEVLKAAEELEKTEEKPSTIIPPPVAPTS